MYKLAKLTLIFSLGIFVVGCNSENTTDSNSNTTSASQVNGSKDKKQEALALYKQAIEHADLATAIIALNQLYMVDSSETSYIDSLAQMYFQTGNFAGALKLGKKVLNREPENHKTMEYVAMAYQNLGDYEKAVSLFDELFSTQNNYKYKYQIATIYFERGQLNKAEKTIDDVIKNGLDDTTKIEMNPTGQLESVPIKAACYTIKGLIQSEGKGNVNVAEVYFKRALQSAPNFQFAKAYLQQLQQYKMAQQQYQNQSPPAGATPSLTPPSGGF